MDEIRRVYIKMGPYQPIKNEYPPTKFGSQNRRFQSHWFKKFTWLEYSPSKDAAFCFPCFLFEHKNPRNSAFTIDGFKYWKRVNDGDRCAFFMHIGCNTSPHNKAVEYLNNLMNIPCHIDKVINAQSSEEKQKNRLRLIATIESIRWLTLQACALTGHDESPASKNHGNFIEMIKFMGKMNESIGDIVLEKAPKNAKYTSPDIQKDILNIISNQVITNIRLEIGDAKFCILVDEARDASNKEQMAIVLRFVDSDGFLKERFFSIVHVTDTTAAILKKEISDALGRYDLHIHNMRGHGYDGASNMRGSWNGLQALFLRDFSCAYNVHCFAHRLQLALIAAAEKEVSIWLFFSKLNSICNLINASPKRHAELHSAQRIEVAHMVATGERDTGRGCNQIGNLLGPEKTRWSSNFDSLCSMIDMYSSVTTVLGICCALEPRENFKFFNVDHVYRLAEKFYSLDFDAQDLHHLRLQLDHYKLDIVGHEIFQNLSSISEWCRRLVETNKSETYNLIDRLIRLVLTLPVSTATTERAFSAMKLVKIAPRNKMEAEFFADSMVIYIERDLVEKIDNDLIILEFDSKKNRRAQLQ
ncbi:uncharacterized protein [Henckelia pumila]|uniref:uncharacterized protein n=1 Tax=Henckelia pumila TaxID=405737 RepID=UPI003C6DE097